MRVRIVLAMPATLGVGASAQTKPGTNSSIPGAAADRSIPALPNPRTNGPDTLPRMLYVSGKLITEEGTPPTDRALIQSNCEGTIRSEGYTDQKGTFSIELANTRDRALSGPYCYSLRYGTRCRRIWYRDNTHPEIRDLSGNTLRELPVPERWGFLLG